MKPWFRPGVQTGEKVRRIFRGAPAFAESYEKQNDLA